MVKALKTHNSIYLVNTVEKTVTGGVFGNQYVNYEFVLGDEAGSCAHFVFKSLTGLTTSRIEAVMEVEPVKRRTLKPDVELV